MFRDESSTLSAKRKRRKDKELQLQERNAHSTSVEPILENLDQRSSMTLARQLPIQTFPNSLVLSAEDQATCFFFHNYVLPDDVVVQGNYRYLYNVYSNQEIENTLADSITALGLSGLAHFWKSSSIMFTSNITYNRALRNLSTQLRDIKTAKADQTLIAVMMLGLYEVSVFLKFLPNLLTWT